ncbi:hypothetical protein LMH81_32360, partial [Vibrio lentus]|uniref:hypothetical protein n=1 Tax=Vibrio lentus TaxID=136468 RepID=UPI001E566DA5
LEPSSIQHLKSLSIPAHACICKRSTTPHHTSSRFDIRHTPSNLKTLKSLIGAPRKPRNTDDLAKAKSRYQCGSIGGP